MRFYNTTNLKGEELKNAWSKTAKQEDVILAVFLTHADIPFTPFEVQDILQRDYEKIYPITSIRRAINTLTEREAIEKTLIRRKGPFGVTNYCWIYRK